MMISAIAVGIMIFLLAAGYAALGPIAITFPVLVIALALVEGLATELVAAISSLAGRVILKAVRWLAPTWRCFALSPMTQHRLALVLFWSFFIAMVYLTGVVFHIS